MSEDQPTLAEIGRSLKRIEQAMNEIREDLQADHDRLGKHATDIAVIQAAIGGWRQWTLVGVTAAVTSAADWFWRR